MYYKEKFMAYMQQITQPIGNMAKIKHLFKIWATMSGASYVKAVKFSDEIVNDSVTSEWKSGLTTVKTNRARIKGYAPFTLALSVFIRAWA